MSSLRNRQTAELRFSLANLLGWTLLAAVLLTMYLALPPIVRHSPWLLLIVVVVVGPFLLPAFAAGVILWNSAMEGLSRFCNSTSDLPHDET